MMSAPDWQDGECCFRCRTQFTLVARKHHCRNCGNIFCAKCSSQQIPLLKLNIEKNVRVCDTCYEKVTGKNQDPSILALSSIDTDTKQDQTPAKKSQSNSKSSSSNASGSNASAPSEQELKEEEELQLALALSLSETRTKVSFPDYRHLDEPQSTTPTKPSTSATSVNVPSAPNEINAPKLNNVSSSPVTTNLATPLPDANSIQAAPGYDLSAIYNAAAAPSTTGGSTIMQTVQVSQQPQLEYHIQDRDQELFKYIGEVHGILEVFNNRLEACKLRNRPVFNDAAVQSLFIKLNSEIQPKLAEYIKSYEDERGVFEQLQDKLSQIADARAALDALREEHQEKMRQLAAEAERQRQSQLASKLEAMRQKKTQMMQYQRELAMQRIREQEMMYQPRDPAQHIIQQQRDPSLNIQQQSRDPPQHIQQQQQIEPPQHSQQFQNNQIQQIALEIPRPHVTNQHDEEAPLISFDD